MNSIVFEVVVDRALAESVVLVRVFHNWLLEVSTEVKYLKYYRVIVMHIIVLVIALI